MANTSSQTKRCESETVPCCCRQLLATIKESETVPCCCRQLLATIKESKMVPKCPVMPHDIFDAAMKGDRDVLIERLGLQMKEQIKIEEHEDSNHESTKDQPFGSEIIPLPQTTSPFATKSNDSTPEKIMTENQTVPSKLQSVTRSGEDTVLHLLVTKKHNELALIVFKRDPSLLKMQNKMLETPLHCAAKVGNQDFQEVILGFNDMTKDVLQETNEKGDTALHVAVRYDQALFCRNLMEFDSELAYTVNKEMFSPFHIAIDEKRDLVAKQMLCVDPILACTQLTDGMFPVHFAARKNNHRMVLHFMENFPDDAELVDSHGRNLFHLVAGEAEKEGLFQELLKNCKDMTIRMNNVTDYEGNTPLHIAAMKGHRDTMHYFWKYMTNCNTETIKNNRGLTPYEVSRNQTKEIWKESWRIESRIRAHEKTIGEKFSGKWFSDVMEPPRSLENKWERTQVIGLGSVLITTVSFTAAFTIPGGYNNQDHSRRGRAVRYMFRQFILANTLAFTQGFISLLALLIDALPGPTLHTLKFSSKFFQYAACNMVTTFGCGLYVTLAPLCLPIAIMVYFITVFIGSPFLFIALLIALDWEGKLRRVADFLCNNWFSLMGNYFSLLFISFLALPEWKSIRMDK